MKTKGMDVETGGAIEGRGGASSIGVGWLLLILAAGLGVRAGWGVYRPTASADPAALEFPDEVDYWGLAASLARGDGLVGEHGFRALRMPLYPAMLAPFAGSTDGTFRAKVQQWPIGAFAAVLAALLGASVAGRAVGIAAGLLVAFDPFLVFFSSLLLNETLFITLLCGLWVAGWDGLRSDAPPPVRRWVLIGLLGAACVYAKESSLGLVALWTGLLLIRHARRPRAWIGAGVVALVLAAGLLPWALRNRQVTGQFCWLTHRGGISLYDGVQPGATGASDLGSIKQMEAVRGLDEAAWDRYFRDRSWEQIRAEPGRMMRLAWVKIARTWNPLPNVDTYQSTAVRWVSAAWTLPVYVLAVVGAWRLRRRRWEVAGLLLPAVYILLLHAVFVGSVRYRLPAMPFLEILTAVGFVGKLIERHRGRECS